MKEVDRTTASWHALAEVRDDAIRSLCRRSIHNSDAEDHVHEAMVRLATRGLTDLDPGRVRGLLIRASWAIAIDHHRRSVRQRRVLSRAFDSAAAPAADEIVAEQSEARWLAASLAGLGAMERRALVHAAAGRRVEEIAALLMVDYKAAANALARARRKLRLLATSVSIALAGLLRRLRHADQGAAVTASAVAAAVLLLAPTSQDRPRPAPPSPPQPAMGVVVLRPDQVQLVDHHVAPDPPRSIQVLSRPMAAVASAKPSVPPAPAPPATAPSPPPPQALPQLPNLPNEQQGRCGGRSCVSGILPGYGPTEPVTGAATYVEQHPFWLVYGVTWGT